MNKKKHLMRYGVLLLSTVMASSTFASAKTNPVVETPLLAAQSQVGFLSNLVKRSDLIFHGELIEISERLSIENIPYTFVTYAVKEVIAGRYAQSTVTLKFVGGQFPNGNRLTASNSPRVALGEEAILMVQKSVDTGCDFVDCESGRFVIEDGQVVAANESAVSVDADGQLLYTTLGERSKQLVKPWKQRSDVSEFISYVKQLDKQSFSKTARTQVSNIDKSAPFKAYSVLTEAGQAPEVPKAISKVATNKGATTTKSEFDLWEEQQVRLNGGDPLLNNNQ